MAAKNIGLFEKQKFSDDFTDNGSQYSNLNLTQNFKCSNVSPVQSNSTLKNGKKFVATNKNSSVVNNHHKNENFQSWNKLSSCSKTSKDLNVSDNSKEVEKKRWKNSDGYKYINNSTLSLHISAYENSFEGSNNLKDLSKKSKTAAAKVWGPMIKVQNQFEFPRQRETKEAISPEVMQFEASQKLLSPNETYTKQMQMVAELEMEMMSDMYRQMTDACEQKCIPTNYHEGDLTKGESVCLDRCVAKYLDVHEKLGKVLTNMSQTDEKAIQQLQQ